MPNRIFAVVLVAATAACASRGGAALAPGSTSADLISEASVRAHMEFLASDALNGRGSGTRDEWIAATYVASEFRRWGLEPLDGAGYVHTIEIERPVLASAPVLTLGGRTFTHGKDFNLATMAAPAISGRIVRIEDGAAAPAGSAVVVAEVTRELSAALASAALVLAKGNGCGPIRQAAGALPHVQPKTVGAAATSRPSCLALGEDAWSAAGQLAPGATVQIEAPVKSVQKSRTWNAVGRLKGSDPAGAEEVILLSAHIDHVGTGRGAPSAAGGDTIYNGADDDASGSVAVLELARAMAAGLRPRRTVVFAWFGSEENGGAGSRYFADKPLVPLERIVANLQFEMIGRPDAKVPARTLWLTGYERSTLGPELAQRGARLVQDPHPEQSFFTRSDNIQFARRGVVAHTVSSFGLHTDYHQPSDEIGAIDFTHMTDAIRSMLAPVAWLANSRFVPAWRPGQKP